MVQVQRQAIHPVVVLGQRKPTPQPKPLNMPPKISAKTVEGNLSRSDTVEIEFLGVTRVFIQQKISGAGLNCLWRSVAASYYGSQNRWNELHRRARDLYAAATSDAAVYLGSPLQIARRELYENIATMASDFLPRLADGKWGEYYERREWRDLG